MPDNDEDRPEAATGPARDVDVVVVGGGPPAWRPPCGWGGTASGCWSPTAVSPATGGWTRPSGRTAGAFAAELQQWASTVSLVPLGDESPDDALPDGVRRGAAPAVSVTGSPHLEGVVLADGSTVPCDAIFLRSATVAVTELAAHLGCALDDDGLIVVDEEGCTSVDDGYAAGDCTPGPQIVQVAAAKGARAGLRCAQS